jgi:hypothetical protein
VAWASRPSFFLVQRERKDRKERQDRKGKKQVLLFFFAIFAILAFFAVNSSATDAPGMKLGRDAQATRKSSRILFQWHGRPAHVLRPTMGETPVPL